MGSLLLPTVKSVSDAAFEEKFRDDLPG